MLALGFLVSFFASAWCAYLAGSRRVVHAVLGFVLPLGGALMIFGARQPERTGILGCLAALVVCALTGLWCGLIAHRKNLNVAGYAALGFFLPPIGWVVVDCEHARPAPVAA